MAEIRAYIVIRIQTVAAPNDNTWNALLHRTWETGTLTKAIRLAGQIDNRSQAKIGYTKRSRNPSAFLRLCLISFELQKEWVDDLLTVANTEADRRGITGNQKDKFTGVLLQEIREAARQLGYSAAQASQITLHGSVFDSRDEANAAARLYLTDNAGVWYNPAETNL